MKLKIIVIDDEECIRDSFMWHLEDQGHEVITAEEPKMCDVYCKQACSKDGPCGHVLFVDYHMPQMTGLDFIEQMAAYGCMIPPANKIIMSGNVADIDEDRVRNAGCQLVEKPLSLARIDAIIEAAKKNIELLDS
mgnify:CR=1 FL=1